MRSFTHQMKKPWVVMPVVAAIAFGGWFAVGRSDDSGSATTSSAAREQVVQATVGTMAKTVTADGTVAASDTEDLSFASAGTVTAVNVKAGDTVKAGQVLATIDSAALQADVSSAEASLADAEAKLADDEDADASDAQIEADASSVASAQDQLDSANEALAGAQLVASIDGTVASVDVTVGEELSSGGTGGTGQTGSGSGSGASASTLGSSQNSLPGGGGTSSSSGTGDTTTADISLVTTGRYTVDLGFDSTDIANVKVGQVATVSLSSSSSSSSGFPGGGFPGGGFPGGFPGATQGNGSAGTGSTTTTAPQITSATDGAKALVTEVGTVADASSGVASFPVTVSFKDTSGTYNVGASVTVAITYAEVTDAVQVPAFAVTTSNGASTVKVKTSKGTETRTVTTGLTSSSMVQITSGLKAGESVVITFPGAGGVRTTTGSGGSGASGSESGGPPAGFTPPSGFTPPGATQGGTGGGS